MRVRNRRHDTGHSRYAEWLCVALGAISVFVVLKWIDLSPEVESEFFFSREDPQLVALQEMDRRFPSPEQVIVRARDQRGQCHHRGCLQQPPVEEALTQPR
jgi:hypothetical protein